MKTILLTIMFSVSSVFAADKIPNRLIDYQAFQKIVADSAQEREAHRLTETQFLATMADKQTVLLDART